MLKGMLLKCAAVSVMLFAAGSVQAQESVSGTVSEKVMKKGKGANKAFMQSLSAEQKEAFKALKTNKKAGKEALQKTFSAEQLAIVNNKDLNKKAKREALKGTYTDAQKELKKANNLAAKNAKESFHSTLSEEQKALMPKGHGGKGKKAMKHAH